MAAGEAGLDGETRFFRLERRGDAVEVSLQGAWTLDRVSQLSEQLGAAEREPARHVTFRCGGLQEIDIAGAWVLHDAARRIGRLGRTIEFVGFKAAHFKFLDEVVRTDEAASAGDAAGPTRGRRWRERAAALGRASTGAFADLGRLARGLLDGLTHPSGVALREWIRQLDAAGVRAVPLVALMAFLIGVIMAFQGATQLRQFGAEIFVVDLVAIAVLREMGSVVTAVVVAGRSGSAFAAELGEMKLSEEVSALRVLGLDPMRVLVVPRIAALVVAMPLLAMVANVAGLAGGMAIAVASLDITPAAFLERVQATVGLKQLALGLLKTPFFGLAIGAVGTFRGLEVSTSSEEVGRKTTAAVVQAIVLIVLIDAVFSVVYAAHGL
jgi:phospholipid/cholesterol/gamma-HCH transport system permease protein